MALTLTPDQEAGKRKLIEFMANPVKPVMVIEGYSGTGKSTLLNAFLEEYDNITKMVKLLNPSYEPPGEVILTATTNKAAEALSYITGQTVKTIYSVLGLRLHYDYKTHQQKLVRADKNHRVSNALIFIDEASYADEVLMHYVGTIARNSKIVWMGDPAQLLNANASKSPVFDAGYPTVKLTKVVRQDENNQIQALSSMFRNAVHTGQFERFTPDMADIVHLDRNSFDQLVVNEFTDPQWTGHQSRILVWTNQKAQKYNKGLLKMKTGDSTVNAGDAMVCNSFISFPGGSIKTDAMVQVKTVTPDTRFGVKGNWVTLRGYDQKFFLPDSLLSKKRAFNKAVREEKNQQAAEINTEWIDLRHVYASTINKSQGSTYDKVFIDLDDINKCRSADNIARLMYVGVSRARQTVYMTGNLT